MYILFTADLHIKLGQKSVPINWSRNRFKMFVSQFSEMQAQADIVIIGGDLFDKIPSMEELELYFELIASITKPCYIYSGNHEMLKKETTFLSNLKDVTERLNPNVIVITDYVAGIYSNLPFDIIPYNKLKEFVQKGFPQDKSRILCTHVRGEIPPHVTPEIDLSLLSEWDIVLAGDLHSYGNCQLNLLYPGSPYTTSYHRNEVETGAILLNTEDLSHQWIRFSLPQLLRKTVGLTDDAKATDFHHTVYEVEGNLHELSELDDNDLIDKIVVRKSQDLQLILDPKLTLVEEVNEYLMYILQLDEPTIALVLKEFHNHADRIK